MSAQHNLFSKVAFIFMVYVSKGSCQEQARFMQTQSCFDKDSATNLPGIRTTTECLVSCMLYAEKCQGIIFESESHQCYMSEMTTTQCFQPLLVYAKVGRYDSEGYAELLVSDYSKVVPDLSHCLSSCSINQTCAAMSYDGETSTCFMSSVPTFLNKSDVEPKAYLKEAHKVNLTVLQFSTQLARGSVVESSSPYPDYSYQGISYSFPASFAADGIYPPIPSSSVDLASLSITQIETSPWIQLTMMEVQWLYGVTMWNRVSAPGQVIANPQILVGGNVEEFNSYTEDMVCGEWNGRPTDDPALFVCVKRILGKCVRITGRNMNDNLSIYEIEMHGWADY